MVNRHVNRSIPGVNGIMDNREKEGFELLHLISRNPNSYHSIPHIASPPLPPPFLVWVNWYNKNIISTKVIGLLILIDSSVLRQGPSIRRLRPYPETLSTWCMNFCNRFSKSQPRGGWGNITLAHNWHVSGWAHPNWSA